MVAKKNPLKLNPLQLKTLTLFQELARYPELSTRHEETGEVLLTRLPQPHGNHFHVGARVVMSKDATGIHNQAVWTVLERKGLMHGTYPLSVTLTQEGLAYDTGLRDEILHGSDH